MHSDSSGKINYWPGFVDAFSNLVLALVFVIVILAMSLGMFSGLMAKMAIQRALIDQQLKESEAAAADNGVSAPAGNADAALDGNAGATLAPGAAQSRNGNDTAHAEPAEEGAGATEPAGTGTAPPEPADHAASAPATRDSAPDPARNAAPDNTARTADSASGRQTAPADAGTDPNPDLDLDRAALRRENDVLRQEIAALRKKNAILAQPSAPIGAGGKPGVTAEHAATAAEPASSGDQKPADKFEPVMPASDHHINQRIEDDLQRALKEFETLRDSRANINVAIYVPSYALTENKRTALFYLISIKDYLMKRKVSPERIRMHMTPAPAGQQEMSVSISVKP